MAARVGRGLFLLRGTGAAGRSTVSQRLKSDETKTAHGSGRLRRLLALGLAAAVGSGVAGSARAASSDLPGLVVPPSTERHAGKMVFTELVTPDLAGARQFYGGLFGWTFQGTGVFAQASLGGRLVAGIVQRPLPTGRQPGWLSFLAAGDVEAADAVATQHGAKLLFAPHPIANLGREAVLADPQGAVFAVMASSSGDPADILAQPGEWIWSSLITTDPAADAAFYKTVFGYDVFDTQDPQDANHLILASGHYARASVNPIPASWTAGRPRWLSYVRVTDMTATIAKVGTLGGRVVLPPRLDRHGGEIALVADPQGALFGLLEWSDDAAGGSAK